MTTPRGGIHAPATAEEKLGWAPGPGHSTGQVATATAQPESRIDARLREVDEVLSSATSTVHALVDRLKPVLPPGFGQQPVPLGQERLDPTSPLAGRLALIADRGQVLVAMLRMLCDEVDL